MPVAFVHAYRVTTPPVSVGKPDTTKVPAPDNPGVPDTVGANGVDEEHVVNVATLALALL